LLCRNRSLTGFERDDPSGASYTTRRDTTFGEVQSADLSAWQGDPNHPQWLKLVEATRQRVGQPAQPRAAPPPPQPQPALNAGALPSLGANSKGRVQAIYVMNLISIVVLGVLAIVGVVMAYSAKDEAQDWLKTHYIFIIRSFWIGLAVLLVGAVTLPISIGAIIIFGGLVWWVVRCVQGLD
jgi:uncharacterized membrane protein